MNIDFIISDFQFLLIQSTHITPCFASLWDFSCLLARSLFVLSRPHVERWFLRIDTEYDPWSGIHCPMCTSLPDPCINGVSPPLSFHDQSVLMIFFVWALFSILVYLGILEIIVSLPKIFGSLFTLAAICAWLLLWLLVRVCFLESWWTRSQCFHIVPLLLLFYQPSHFQMFKLGLWARKILHSISFSLDWLRVF